MEHSLGGLMAAVLLAAAADARASDASGGVPLPAQTAAYAPPAAASVRINFNPGWRLAKGSHPVDGTDDAGWEKGDHYDCAVLRAAIAKQPASAPAKSQPGENHGKAK